MIYIMLKFVLKSGKANVVDTRNTSVAIGDICRSMQGRDIDLFEVDRETNRRRIRVRVRRRGVESKRRREQFEVETNFYHIKP